jgi:TDG/mug DNA glycosylase family protein
VSTLLHGLAPVIDARSRVLVLGSFPSATSLAAQQYYAHRQNQFWRIMAALLGRPLPALDYPQRLAALREDGIALWDVYASCQRDGSLDSAIRYPTVNDFQGLRAQAPGLQRVCFNGQTAGRLLRMMSELGYPTCVLPSTSPAHTLAFEAKLDAWHAGLLM